MDYSRTVSPDEIAAADMTGLLLLAMLVVVAAITMGFLWEAFFG